jgi:hypothetical protein
MAADLADEAGNPKLECGSEDGAPAAKANWTGQSVMKN